MKNIGIITKIKFLLEPNQLKKVYFIILLIIIGMFFEMLGLGVLFPILSFIINPNSLNQYKIFLEFKTYFNNPNDSTLTLILLTFLIGFYLIKTFFLLYLNWERNSLSINISKSLSHKLFKGYLNQEYHFHLNNNSSTLLKNIQSEVQLFTAFATALINITVEFSFSIGIILILIFSEPKGAFIVLAFLGTSVYIFGSFTKKKLKQWSNERLKHSIIINKSLIEGLSAIKDLIIFNRVSFFYEKYIIENEKHSRIITKVNFLDSIPRIYLEMLSIVGISILIIITKTTNNNTSLVPILGIFAAAAFRIIPSLNSMMKSIQLARFSSSTINLLSEEFHKIKSSNRIESSQNDLTFNKSICVSNLNFKFETSETQILTNLSFNIKKGETVGFIGSSGSGKSTLIDIIIGLHKPQSGSVFVDDININKNELIWRKKIGYIPQSIYILDDTLKKNIAFALPENEIDNNRVLEAIEAAQLTEFVNNLPSKIDTYVGEKGVRISGGQRQRIGIARALYNNPDVLILDEATSALDLNTENHIMQTILKLRGKKTILIVAHRLKTLENCDRIIVIEQGRLKEQGEPNSILNKYK